MHNHLIGKRVRLVFTDDPYTNLKPGNEGEEVFVDDFSVHVNWDNGTRLGLMKGQDRWEVIS